MAEKKYIQEGVVLDNIKSAHIHLCSTCKHTYPECPAEADDVLFGYYDNVCACAEYHSTPAADVAQVRHASWIKDGYTMKPCVCSNCGEPCKDTVMGKPRWNYCPNCGAKMDGGQGE